MPAFPEQQDSDTQDGSFDCMQAMVSATDDPSILTSQPPEGFDLSYAQIHDPSHSNAYPQSFEQQYPYQAYTQQDPQQQHVVSDETRTQQHAEAVSYYSFNYQMSGVPYASNNDVASSSHAPSLSSVPGPEVFYFPSTDIYHDGLKW